MKLAFLGGSFNPIHIGHLALAEQVRCLGYDKVLFIPVNIPPHKMLASGASSRERLEMLHLAVDSNPDFAVDSCEIERSGVSYTYETVRYLNKSYAGELEAKPALIMGWDQALGFNTWNRPDEIASNADIIIARRPDDLTGNSFIQDKIDFPYPHILLKNAPLAISSSAVREKIKSGGAWRYLVPDEVYRYIIKNNLYGYC